MSLPVPDLDTIDFERLVEDARALIPRFAPAWTDHNVHDPGITLIELLAWATDQEIYRLGFVGESYLKAFAALLGASLQHAKPARGLVWPLDEGVGPQNLDTGQRIACTEQPDVSFLIQRELFISDAACKEMVATAGQRAQRVDYLGNGNGVFAPVLAGANAVRHIAFKFSRPLVPPLEQPPDQSPPKKHSATIALGIEVDPFPGIDGDAPQSWGPIAFDYAIGDEIPRPVHVVDDGTLALARTNVVLLDVRAATPDEIGRTAKLRLRFDRGFFPVAPRIRRIAINVLPVVQLATRPEDAIGRGTGLPDQVVDFDLTRVPAEEPGIQPFKILVDADEWTIVSDFEDSEPYDRHVVADRRRGRLRFGNGINGRIPPRDSQIRHASFQATDGESGNLGARLTWSLPGIAAKFGKNLQPFTGGENAWTVDRELRAEMRERATKRDALLTNGDVKAAVEGLAGFSVARAEVVARHVPSLPRETIRGSRTLVVVPARDARTSPTGPVPRAYLDALAERLASRRLLGERFSVVGPTYAVIDLTLRLLAAPGSDAEAVRRAVKERIGARLTDLWREPDLPPWPLGRPVTSGEIKGLVAQMAEVDAVLECRIGRAGTPLSEDDLPLGPTEIAVAGAIAIVVAPENVRRR